MVKGPLIPCTSVEWHGKSCLQTLPAISRARHMMQPCHVQSLLHKPPKPISQNHSKSQLNKLLVATKSAQRPLQHHLAGTKSCTEAWQAQQALSVLQEEVLTGWIKYCGFDGIPLSKSAIQKQGELIAGHVTNIAGSC